MRLLNLVRIALALLLSAAAYYIISSHRVPNVKLLPGEQVNGQFAGDYHGRVDLENTSFKISEQISFVKSKLDSFTYQRFLKMLTQGRQPDSAQLRFARANASRMVPNWRMVYFQRMGTRGWTLGDTSDQHYRFKRQVSRTFRRDGWHRFQVLPIGLLFEELGNTDVLQHDTLVIDPRRLVDFNYKLSAGSELALYSPHGLVTQTYPAAKPADLLDEGNREVYRFNAADLNQLTDNEHPAMVLRLRLLNPWLNNVIGETTKDWGPGKVLGWLILSLVALFGDKLKKKILEPVADRIWPDRKEKKQEPRPKKRPAAPQKKKAVKD
ncbi:hypothetical protein C8P68_10512 [Mucilaginibacter yixingensis]|uniref:Uncharacterized protein n=1 Tax=Mucilaginibacter yixingensis TaxID=1295612 RepID=A0A2T5J7S2_9SPHI|nr:DUF2462 domain-containing protein [Mucilaginibacter yixingensis]PTQ95507.1 hypothetical protein C8P68_10512 [Mucilaginibacter yixingensis]